MANIVTSALMLGAIGYVAKMYMDKRKLAGLEKDGAKMDILLQPLETAQLGRSSAAKQKLGLMTVKGAVGGSSSTASELSQQVAGTMGSTTQGDYSNWWVVANELVNATAPDYEGYNPLALTLEPQPIVYGDRRNFYDPVNRRV